MDYGHRAKIMVRYLDITQIWYAEYLAGYKHVRLRNTDNKLFI